VSSFVKVDGKLRPVDGSTVTDSQSDVIIFPMLLMHWANNNDDDDDDVNDDDVKVRLRFYTKIKC